MCDENNFVCFSIEDNECKSVGNRNYLITDGCLNGVQCDHFGYISKYFGNFKGFSKTLNLLCQKIVATEQSFSVANGQKLKK